MKKPNVNFTAYVTRGILVLFLGLTLTACGGSQKPWGLTNITGLMPNLSFTLTDQDGHTTTAKDFLGKVTLLYFGYTSCPDICPTTMAMLSQTLHDLGPLAKQVRILFVTVDPARDTPAVLKKYVKSFGTEFIGLRAADDPTLRALTKRYRVTYSRGKPDAHGFYEVSHSSAVFVFDRKGRIRLMTTPQDKSAVVTADLRRLLTSS